MVGKAMLATVQHAHRYWGVGNYTVLCTGICKDPNEGDIESPQGHGIQRPCGLARSALWGTPTNVNVGRIGPPGAWTLFEHYHLLFTTPSCAASRYIDIGHKRRC